MAEETLQIYSFAMAVLGGVVFWAGFLIFGIIAKRYSAVFARRTYYGLLMAAPSGVLAYSFLLIVKSSFFIKSAEASNLIQAAAYVFLFLSACLCLAAAVKFNSLLNELVKYKG